MSQETAWLIGSTYVPETGISIDGNLYVFPAGYYYLRHTTAALSLIATLDGLLDDEGIAGHNVYVAKDRKVRIVANAGFTLDWPTALSELFGFFGDLDGMSATETALHPSPLLWSPGKTESPQEAPLGVQGRNVYDTRFGTAPDGTQVADSHHTQVINTFDWNHVPTSRFQTALARGGEYTVFFDYVLRKAYKFRLYRLIDEDTASSSPVTWTLSPLGPYGFRPTRGAISWDFQRSPGATRFDRFNQVSLDCIITPEWGEI